MDVKKIPARGMLRKMFLPFPLKITWNGLSLSNIMEYYSDSVSPESSRMIYITWGVNQGLIF